MVTCFLCSAVISAAEDTLISHLVRQHPGARFAISGLAAGLTAVVAPRGQRQVALAVFLVSMAFLTSTYGSARRI
jgi:hypothetical protein